MLCRRARFVAVLAFFAAIAGPWQPALAQGEPTEKIIYTLEPDERIDPAESVIMLSAESEDVALVLAKREGNHLSYFAFHDGKKSGPYAQLAPAVAAAFAGRKASFGKKHECAVYDPGEPPEGARPRAGYEADGRQVIQFRGKSFGPYPMIFATRGTPDGAAVYFTAADNNKSWFGCSDGRVVSFGGIPADIKFSPDGKNGAVMVQGKLSLDAMNDLTKLPPEKMAEAFKDQEKKYLYTIDGKAFGPFESSFGSHSFWYPKSGHDLYYRVGDDVFKNGSLLFKSSSFDRCNFYTSPDGQSYAMFTYESLVFSDGRKFPPPLDVAVVQRSGKTVFRWIALEDEKKLVVHERAM